MSKQPLAEVFGYPISNNSRDAQRHRKLRLCPYNNKVPSCTKDKASDPLGVCTVFDHSDLAITCPIRFRQNWLIAEDAAGFFFPPNINWTSLSEVRLNDNNGKSAGNIDLVLVSYDIHGRILDFGALEVQAVYISGNIRKPFEYFMEYNQERNDFDWSNNPLYPNPDYLSSSRKRLVPQLIYKGGILSAWKKKTAVAIHKSFYDTLPILPEVSKEQATLAWLIYDLAYDEKKDSYDLNHEKTVYTLFHPALERVTNPQPGEIGKFIDLLQEKLDEKLDENNPPDAPVLNNFFPN